MLEGECRAAHVLMYAVDKMWEVLWEHRNGYDSGSWRGPAQTAIFSLGLKRHGDIFSSHGFMACKDNHKINVSSIQGPLN